MSLTLKAFLGYLVSKTFAVSGSPSAHYWRLCIYWRPQNTYCQKTSGQCEIPMMSISYVMSVLMKVFFKPNNSSRTQLLIGESWPKWGGAIRSCFVQLYKIHHYHYDTSLGTVASLLSLLLTQWGVRTGPFAWGAPRSQICTESRTFFLIPSELKRV